MGANFYIFTHSQLLELGFQFDVGEDGIYQTQKDFNFEFIVEGDIYRYMFNELNLKEQDGWCQEHLQGFFKLDRDRSSFEIEEDAFAFKLTWL